jgi:hypothetical protein
MTRPKYMSPQKAENLRRQRVLDAHRRVSQEATEHWPKLTKRALAAMNEWWDDRVRQLTRSEPGSSS